jgi:dienelactone hydrolase
MENSDQICVANTKWVDHIPVIWVEPQIYVPDRRLVIFLHPFSGSKETMVPILRELAREGYVALSFDAWQHGERGKESRQEIFERVFGNFRRHMWPILGQTTLDTLRVIDWAISSLDVQPHIYLGGLSMGGDIAVSAAGLDNRIQRVGAVFSTPDWLRPGMEDVFNPGTLLPSGESDSLAQYYYDQLNPITHLASYEQMPEIHFLCGENDTHVPLDGAFRFQSAMKETYPSAADKISVSVIPNLNHLAARDHSLWWPSCMGWLIRN